MSMPSKDNWNHVRRPETEVHELLFTGAALPQHITLHRSVRGRLSVELFVDWLRIEHGTCASVNHLLCMALPLQIDILSSASLRHFLGRVKTQKGQATPVLASPSPVHCCISIHQASNLHALDSYLHTVP